MKVYLLTYRFDGITDSNGFIFYSMDNLLQEALPFADTAIDLLGDSGIYIEWQNLSGEEVEFCNSLKVNTTKELIHYYSQLDDYLKVHEYGYFQVFEYTSLFDLIEDQSVEKWCNEGINKKIEQLRKQYRKIVLELNDEWAGY
jgi:hypothetical protein